MAHIAALMVDATDSVGLNNYIARERSPHASHDAFTEPIPIDGKEKFVWRMHQPTETRKYQLFPQAKETSTAAKELSVPKTPSHKSSISSISSFSESEAPMATVQNVPAEKERTLLASAKTLIRRRKVSVPELGQPMTTVQEIPMDSPTIPGRPPLHERSTSAPGNSWRQHVFAESMVSCISGPALDENAERSHSPEYSALPLRRKASRSNNLSRTASPHQPASPKMLTPLVIPQSESQAPRLARNTSLNRCRSGSTPPDVPPKSARYEQSPHPRASPYTPLSSSTSLQSMSTAPSSISATPTSALEKPSFSYPLEGRCSPIQGRRSPMPWANMSQFSTSAPTMIPMGHARGQSQDNLSHTLSHQRSSPLIYSHRRHESEGASSIMDRGRPKKRSPIDASPGKVQRSFSRRSPSNPFPQTQNGNNCTSPSPQKSKSDEQRAFEHLPSGHAPLRAVNNLSTCEIKQLYKQAFGQATRFQVLPQVSVDSLSRELRALDERCEYLRRTHRSLRTGRKNLHERICTYLRSPRTAKFSHESILKQEEALSELDTSIDDWVSKLEQAENRRMRIRQKLLEHVAAALIVPSKSPAIDALEQENEKDPSTPPRSPTKETRSPPRSPTKMSASPERLERVIEEVKFVCPAPEMSSSPPRTSTMKRTRALSDAESIRIYADSDVYALMRDLDNEINRMGEQEKVLREKEEKAKRTEVEEKKAEEKKPGVNDLGGFMLTAVTFEGMALHTQRSKERMAQAAAAAAR